MKIKQNIAYSNRDKLKSDIAQCTGIDGWADFIGWQGSAPNLKSIGGNAWFEGWQGNAPNLVSIDGSADFRDWQGSAPNLKSIGGRSFKWGEAWK